MMNFALAVFGTAITLGLASCSLTIARSNKFAHLKLHCFWRGWWWIIGVVAMSTVLIDFLIGFSTLQGLTDKTPDYDVELKVRCDSIKGQFYGGSNACYRDGIKINFGADKYEE